MQFTLCQHCACLLPWGQKRCLLCQTAQVSDAPRSTICRKDGTPVPLSEPVCPTCHTPVKVGILLPIWVKGMLALLFGVGVFLLLFELHTAISATYRPATCLIQAGQVVSSSNRNGTTYQAMFDATVFNDQGQEVLSLSDDSLGLPGYDNAEQAQQDLDQHAPGSFSPCKYSSVAWRKALLTDVPNAEMPLWVRVGFSAIIALLAGLAGYLFYVILSDTWCLSRRGIATTGTVLRKERRRSRNRRWRNFSIIEFQTRSEPPLKASSMLGGSLPLQSSVSVLYDPLHPDKRARASVTGNPLSPMPIVFGLLTALLVLAGSGLLAFLSVMS